MQIELKTSEVRSEFEGQQVNGQGTRHDYDLPERLVSEDNCLDGVLNMGSQAG